MKSAQRKTNIDIGLAVIAAVTPPGHRWAMRDIAAVCGCSHSTLVWHEQRALTKLRRAAASKGITP